LHATARLPRKCLFTVRWRAGPSAGATDELLADRICLRPWEPPAPDDDADAAAAVAEASAAALPPPPLTGAAAPFLSDARVASAVCEFFAWCSWREEAQAARRGGGAPPWSSHPVMAAHHFCNVSRLEDRGTAAFHAFLRAQRVTSLAGTLWCSLVYRRLNRLATFVQWGRLPLPSDAAAWADWVQARAADPDAAPLFTGKHQQSGGLAAYVATVRGLAGVADADAPPGFPHVRALAAALAACPGAREAHGTLKAHVRHVGDFIAWQVCCDLVEAGVLPAAATDAWVALGPGARTGLALIFGDGAGSGGGGGGGADGDADAAEEGGGEGSAAAACGAPPVSGDAAMARLRALQAAQPWALAALRRGTHGAVAAGVGEPPLLLRDLEHSLCEFQKWLSLRRGGVGPGGYWPGEEPLPLLPAMRVERLEGGAFRVAPPDGVEAPAAGAACAAFPPEGGVAADVASDLPALLPWMPRDVAGGGRRRGGGPRAPRTPREPKGPRPERAALQAWFDAFWPGAQTAGWVCITKTRQAGATAGTLDSYWISPSGRRLRSRAEVAAHEGMVFAPPPAPPAEGEPGDADAAADGAGEPGACERDSDGDEVGAEHEGMVREEEADAPPPARSHGAAAEPGRMADAPAVRKKARLGQ
jgi:hypothetical protein